MSTAQPSDGLPDFSQWRAPGEGDARSPCPMLNALANHGFLPRDGKGLTRSMVQEGAAAVGADPKMIGKVYDMAKPTIPKGYTHLELDYLSKHGILEHNASLSRQDVALGDNTHLDKDIWQTVLDVIGDRNTIDYATAAKIRKMRFTASKQAHKTAKKPFDYDLKALTISYIETSALFRVFLAPGTTEVPVKYIRTLLEEGRLPYDEGWRPCSEAAGRPSVTKIIVSIIWNNGDFWREFLVASGGSIGGLATKILHSVAFWKR